MFRDFSHLSRHDMTVGPTDENFRSARCARGKNLIFAYFIQHNNTKSIKSRRKYHRAEKDADVYFGRTTQNLSHISWIPKIFSHLSRHDMTCLSGSQISSHLSRFISDKSPPKIESFVARNVATNIPRANGRLLKAPHTPAGTQAHTRERASVSTSASTGGQLPARCSRGAAAGGGNDGACGRAA